MERSPPPVIARVNVGASADERDDNGWVTITAGVVKRSRAEAIARVNHGARGEQLADSV